MMIENHFDPRKQQIIIAVLLLVISLFLAFDIYSDMKEGAIKLHLIIEAMMGLMALGGFIFLVKKSEALKKELIKTQIESEQLRQQALDWKKSSQKYIEGLALSIDQQLTKWNLSTAEKEIALLLLKGLSIKEIADVRGTAEKTVRTQSLAIYAKSGLSGRTELAAFFLEDLLLPSTPSI